MFVLSSSRGTGGVLADEHRLVYKIVDDQIRIAACRYHYER
ncbi:type II toxin-antitoxin system YoeB family toxin [Actinocorallia aurantiaca]